VKVIIKNEKLRISSSVLVEGDGYSDLCIGVPVTIDKHGATITEEINMKNQNQNQNHLKRLLK
jgi:malate/lactate dehydrogenase